MGSSSSSSSSSIRDSSSVSCFLKLLVRAIVVVGLMWILLAGTPEGTVGATTKTRTNLAAEYYSTAKIKGKDDQVVVATEEKLAHPKLDLINYMSKRRVPNGPDPIHNRRAGKKGRPPGQA
ncbi:CLAVATA3/ESR (CLE)-related protein [Trema orientale]|uniref:CLAVATA3/ESR (CLE)-related protein n=1 Tax=Trema orientale TaxID=63057 RepID=A0A2P5BY63_TREOI|nr:CLAVATA3/ESR (CLE)-related protein [Trema orientale]